MSLVNFDMDHFLLTQDRLIGSIADFCGNARLPLADSFARCNSVGCQLGWRVHTQGIRDRLI
jgi:hypothetical protein